MSKIMSKIMIKTTVKQPKNKIISLRLDEESYNGLRNQKQADDSMSDLLTRLLFNTDIVKGQERANNEPDEGSSIEDMEDDGVDDEMNDALHEKLDDILTGIFGLFNEVRDANKKINKLKETLKGV